VGTWDRRIDLQAKESVALCGGEMIAPLDSLAGEQKTGITCEVFAQDFGWRGASLTVRSARR
jgi:hypothetical protein